MLLEFLICERGPFTIEEMRRSLRKLNLDLVTVYRCMRAFEKVGLVVRCEFGDGISRYEYQGAEGHHHHVICINCRKTENIEGCGLLVLEEKVRQLGYSGVKHSLEFFGLCKVCELKTQ
jgi:Fur family ferric uptake transcriptional regulator